MVQVRQPCLDVPPPRLPAIPPVPCKTIDGVTLCPARLPEDQKLLELYVLAVYEWAAESWAACRVDP